MALGVAFDFKCRSKSQFFCTYRIWLIWSTVKRWSSQEQWLRNTKIFQLNARFLVGRELSSISRLYPWLLACTNQVKTFREYLVLCVSVGRTRPQSLGLPHILPQRRAYGSGSSMFEFSQTYPSRLSQSLCWTLRPVLMFHSSEIDNQVIINGQKYSVIHSHLTSANIWLVEEFCSFLGLPVLI